MPRTAKLGIFEYNHVLTWSNNYAISLKALRECRDSSSLRYTEKFGPRMWHIMHTLMAEYPVEPAQPVIVQCATFFNELTECIPCKECQKHFRDMLGNKRIVPMPIIDLAAKGNLVMNVLTWNMHNNVNKRLQKPLFKWTQYVEKYNPIVKELPDNYFKHFEKKNLV